jgi:PBP1b-binding outer membrane lipoprotein LpoB
MVLQGGISKKFLMRCKMKKNSLLWIIFLIISTVLLLTGCQALGQSTKANVSKADVSQTVFAQFKEEGFDTIEEAEEAALDMYAKKNYKAMVDHSTAESMIEGAFEYDGVTEFYAYFTQYLKSRFGDSRGQAVYNNIKQVQAWKAKDGMTAHYSYTCTNKDGTEFGTGFSIVNKNGKFLLAYDHDEYIFEELFFKFSSGKEIMMKLIPDIKNSSNVILPIALEKSVGESAARPWKIWMAIASQHRMKLKSIHFITDTGKFDVKIDSKMGPEGAILYVEAPMKFGKVKQATATDKDGRTYEFKILEDEQTTK